MNQTAVFSSLLRLMAIVTTFLSPIARGDDLPSLERALRTAAPGLLRFAKDRRFANVGVLKFRIKKGDGQLSESVGAMNLRLAERLETALILANDVRQPIGIVHDASSVAATIPGASHLTKEGRQQLFKSKYPLAWGDSQVSPDAFFVGIAHISADYKTMTVGIAICDRNAEELINVTQFDAKPNTTTLVETGESFSVRGLFDGGKVEINPKRAEVLVTESTIQQAANARQDFSNHPLNSSTSPVALDVRYDDKRIDFEFKAGEIRIREPLEGEQVTFTLRRRDPKDERRYACVLKVNGENTLFHQRQNDFDCNKWVLEKAHDKLVVRGFQKTDNKVAPFKILSRAESQAKQMDYSADIGLISLTVFVETGKNNPLPRPLAINLADEDEDAAIIQAARFPDKKPKSLDALKSQITFISKTRGVIDEGKDEKGDTITVPFDADPRPIMSATVRYYRPNQK